MKTLFILRHAKSSWNDPGLPDHDRPLNDRGKHDAPRIGELIRGQGLIPDLIVSSTAKRAERTAQKVAKTCGYAGEIQLLGGLYQAYPDYYLQFLRQLDNQFGSVMVVGHNPCLEELVEMLTGCAEPMPTAALAKVALDIDAWADLAIPPGGELIGIWRPKELSSPES